MTPQRFTHHSSPHSHVHRLDARVKTLVVLVYILAMVTTPPQHLLAFIVYAGILLWTVALAQIPLRFIAVRAAAVLPFSAFVAVGLPFLGGGEAVSFMGMHLSIAGLWILAGVMMKSFLGAAAIILLMATTPFSDLLDALRRLHIPAFFIDILALAYRYLFLLIEEAQRLSRAAFARGYKPKWLPQSVIVGRMIGHLFVRSYERAERVCGAMRLRGYKGIFPASDLAPLSLSHKIGLAAAFLLIIGIRVFVP